MSNVGHYNYGIWTTAFTIFHLIWKWKKTHIQFRAFIVTNSHAELASYARWTGAKYTANYST